MLKSILKYVLYVIPFVLLINPDSMFFPFISGKNILFRVLIDIGLVCGLFLFFSDKTFRFKKNIISYLVFGFLISVFISDLFAFNSTKAFLSNFERSEGFITVFHLGAYFILLILTFRFDQKLWNRFFGSFLIVSFASMLFGALQLSGGAVINQGGTRADSVFGNAAYFAGFMLLSFFITLFLWSKKDVELDEVKLIPFWGSIAYVFVYSAYINDVPVEMRSGSFGIYILILSLIYSALIWFFSIQKKETIRNITPFLLFGTLAFLNLFFAYKTQTRGALLGIIGGTFISSLIIIFSSHVSKNIKKIAIGLVAVILLSVIGFISFKDSNFVKSSPTLDRLSQMSLKETNTQARALIWPMALQGIKDRPIFGWGQEGYMYIFQKYYNPKLWRHEPWFDRTHNVFLDWLVAGGVVVFSVYISFYIVALWASIKMTREHYVSGAILIGLICAYGFQNLFIFDNLASYLVFFALLAYLSNFTVLNKEEIVNKDKDVTQNSSGLKEVIVVFGCIAVVSIFYLSVIKPFNQNTGLIGAIKQMGQIDVLKTNDMFKDMSEIKSSGQMEVMEQYLEFAKLVIASQAVTPEVKSRVAEDFVNRFNSVLEIHKNDARSLMAFASFYQYIGFFDKALPILLKAEQLSPNKQAILFQIGFSYLEMKDEEKGIEYLKKAYDSAPNYDQASQFYGYGLIRIKKYDEAKKVLLDLTKSGVNVENFIIETLLKENKSDIAIELVNSSISVNPSYEKSYTDLISIYSNLKNKNGVLNTIERMKQVDSLKLKAEEIEKTFLTS